VETHEHFHSPRSVVLATLSFAGGLLYIFFFSFRYSPVLNKPLHECSFKEAKKLFWIFSMCHEKAEPNISLFQMSTHAKVCKRFFCTKRGRFFKKRLSIGTLWTQTYLFSHTKMFLLTKKMNELLNFFNFSWGEFGPWLSVFWSSDPRSSNTFLRWEDRRIIILFVYCSFIYKFMYAARKH